MPLMNLRPVNDSRNAPPVSQDIFDPLLQAYRDSAENAFNSQQQAQAFANRSIEGLVSTAAQIEHEAFAQKQQAAAFEQQKEMENLRTRNEIYKEREQYDYQTNKNLDRIRAAEKEIDLQPWPENVKAQMRGALKAQEMGIKADPKNFAPKPPTVPELIKNDTIHYDEKTGTWFVPKDLGIDIKTITGQGAKATDQNKVRTQYQKDLDNARAAIKNADPTRDPSEPVSDADAIQRVISDLKLTKGSPEEIAHWQQQLEVAKAAQKATSSKAASAGNFTPGKAFKTPMEAVAVLAVSQQGGPSAPPPARVAEAIAYLNTIRDSLEPRELAVLNAAEQQQASGPQFDLNQLDAKPPSQLTPEEIQFLKQKAGIQ